MIDSHAHLTSPDLLEDVDAIVDRAIGAGVEKIVNICTDSHSLQEGISLKKRKRIVFNTAATTPHDVEKDGEHFFPIVEKHSDQLVAIGETGLDYYYEHSPKSLQREFLSRYFELAKQVSLPMIFHCREAFPDLFAMSDEVYRERPAVLHCFTGTKEEAKRCLDRDWFISFSGIITFKKSVNLREIARYVPLEKMFIETDSPYLAPQSKRGKRNEPAFVGEIAETIAREKEIPISDVIEKTSENISRFFEI